MIVCSCSCEDDGNGNGNDGSIAPWRQTRWLVLSSGLFLFPAYLATRKQRPDLAVLLATTSLVSTNYWRCARTGWRRNLDLIYGKLSFLTMFGVWARESLSPDPLEASLYVPTVAGLYALSNYTHRFSPDTDIWWRIHVLFHISLLYGQWRVLHGLPPGLPQ